MIVIEIDGKPVAKGRGRIGRMADGRPTIFTPAATRANENLIKMQAMRAMKGRDPIEGAVEVTVNVFISPPKSMTKGRRKLALCGVMRPCAKPDTDNFLKSALDGINTIVFRDDNQVVDLHGHKHYREKAGMVIEVREIGSAVDMVV